MFWDCPEHLFIILIDDNYACFNDITLENKLTDFSINMENIKTFKENVSLFEFRGKSLFLCFTRNKITKVMLGHRKSNSKYYNWVVVYSYLVSRR